MSTLNSGGLRGSTLEDMINMSNDIYRAKKMALVQKIPTHITPIRIDKKSRHITLAYFAEKSTVDYLGNVQGVPVCFDAKECKEDRFPIDNIHEHQVKFMKDMENQGGIAFLIIFFTTRNELYYMPFREVLKFWDRAKKGGKKSFHYTELEEGCFLSGRAFVPVHYLEGLKKDLESRNEET